MSRAMRSVKQEYLPMKAIERLRARRDKLQSQLDQWIARGFRGGGKVLPDATRQETADKVAEVANLNTRIAEQKAEDRDA